MKPQMPPTFIPQFTLPQKAKENPSLEQVLTTFLSNHRFTAETKRAYKREIKGFFRCLTSTSPDVEHLRNLALSELCLVLQQYLSGFLKVEQETDQILNPNSFNRVFFALKSFFNYLRKIHGYPCNPLDYFEKLDVPTHSTTQELTEAELFAFLRYLKERSCKGHSQARNFLLVLGMFLEGLRRREIAELRWNQIDFVSGIITPIQKGRKRKIKPIPKGYLHLLEDFRKAYPSDSPYVFTPVQNNRFKNIQKPISPSYLYQLVVNTAKVVIPSKKITPHSFRASFITIAQKWKQDPVAIIRGSGHLSLKMLDFYDKRESLEYNAINFFGQLLHKERIFDKL